MITKINSISKDVGKAVGKDVGKDVGKELLSLIEKNPEITIPALAEILNVTSRTVERQLNRLKKENKIAREGGRKEGKWVLL